MRHLDAHLRDCVEELVAEHFRACQDCLLESNWRRIIECQRAEVGGHPVFDLKLGLEVRALKRLLVPESEDLFQAVGGDGPIEEIFDEEFRAFAFW